MKSLSPNDYGERLLVECCPQVRVRDMLWEWRSLFKEALAKSSLAVEGLDLELCASETNYKGRRLWFRCPLCRERVGVIYRHPLTQQVGCRKCLNLDYRSRRFKGMIETERVWG